MGLIKCPDCQKEISDIAIDCPNCGRPLQTSINTQQNFENSQAESYGVSAIKPKKKRKRWLIIIFVVVIIIAVSYVLSSLNSDGKNESKNSTVSETTKAEEANVNVEKGKSGNISDGLSLVVNKVSEQNSISALNGYAEYKPDSGKYAIVNVTIKNNSKESQNLLLNYFNLIGPDNEAYVATIISSADDKFITVDTVNPNLSITGNLVFEIPKNLDVSDCKLQYSDYDLFNEISSFKLK